MKLLCECDLKFYVNQSYNLGGMDKSKTRYKVVARYCTLDEKNLIIVIEMITHSKRQENRIFFGDLRYTFEHKNNRFLSGPAEGKVLLVHPDHGTRVSALSSIPNQQCLIALRVWLELTVHESNIQS